MVGEPMSKDQAHEAAAAAAAQQDGEQSEQEVVAPGLSSMLASLSSIPEDKQTFNVKQLLKCIDAQQQLLDLIADPDAYATAHPAVDVHTKASALFLENYYYGITGMNHVVSLDMLEPEAVDSGLCAELITPHEAGGCPSYALPTTPGELCTHIAELLRFCCAGLVAFYCFREFRTRRGQGFSSDDAMLSYSELAIRSCIDKQNAAALEEQLKQELPDTCLTIARIRFLMHYIRGELFGNLAALNRLLGDKEPAARFYFIQQKEYLFMIKTMPSSGLGYVKYCASCMLFQAMQAAAAFLSRGIQHCEQAGDSYCLYQLHFMAAVSMLLGGNGPKFTPAVVSERMAAGQAALDSFLSWAPDFWHEGATSNSHRELVLEKLLPGIAQRESVEALVPDLEYDVLKAHYVPQPPQYMPAGVMAEGEDGEDAAADGAQQDDALPAIAEGAAAAAATAAEAAA